MEKYTYSTPIFDFDAAPIILRSIVLSVDDEKYYLVFDDGWKEVIGDDEWNHLGFYELKE